MLDKKIRPSGDETSILNVILTAPTSYSGDVKDESTSSNNGCIYTCIPYK